MEAFKTLRSRSGLAILLMALMLLNLVPGAVHAGGQGQMSTGGQGSDPIKGIQSLWAWFVALFHALLDGRGGTAGQTKPTDGMAQPSVKPPESLPDPRAMEREILALINKERSGVKPAPYTALVWDDKLAGVARARAAESIASGSGGHSLPSGLPSIALTKIGYLGSWAENVFATSEAGDSAAIARACVKGWMDSPGHRSNMLWPEARSIGVGVTVSEAPVNLLVKEHGGEVVKGIHVTVYAIFYDGK
ncbi:MAG: CAP domain-containing protein [Bacillota bacterium]